MAEPPTGARNPRPHRLRCLTLCDGRSVRSVSHDHRPQDNEHGQLDRANRVAFTYDATRGHLVPLTRTDPLIGTTSFEHDARNRRTAEIDPNGTRTETSYDPLDRMRFTRVCNVATPSTPCGATETLVTEHQYDTFGDLVHTILPRGNLIEYGCDGVGRLVRMERRPDAAPTASARSTRSMPPATARSSGSSAGTVRRG